MQRGTGTVRKLSFFSYEAQSTFRGERVVLHKYTKGINTVEGGKKGGGNDRWAAVSVKDSSGTRKKYVYSDY